MGKVTDRQIIDVLGGPEKLAEKLGYEKPQGIWRISNWRSRGIPSSVRLENLNLFKRAEKKVRK